MISYSDLCVSLSGELPVEKMYHWRNMPDIFRWSRQNSTLTYAEHEEWIKKLATDKSRKVFAILVKDTKEAVGICAFSSIDPLNQNAQFSLYIAPEYQGKGYGRDGLIALCRHGFRDFNFHRIWGETFERNPARDVFLSIGMKHEGTLQESYYRDGKWINSHLVGVIRDKWEFLTEADKAVKTTTARKPTLST